MLIKINDNTYVETAYIDSVERCDNCNGELHTTIHTVSGNSLLYDGSFDDCIKKLRKCTYVENEDK